MTEDYTARMTRALTDRAIEERNEYWDELNEHLDACQAEWEAELESIEAEIRAEEEAARGGF